MGVSHEIVNNEVYTNILHVHVFLTLIIYMFTAVNVPVYADHAADSYREYNMAAMCGSVIDLDSERTLVGQIVFNDNTLPVGDHCSVGVLPHESYKYTRIAYHVTDYNLVRTTALIFSEGNTDGRYITSVDNITERRELGRIYRPYFSERYDVTIDQHDSQTDEGRALVIHFAPGVSTGMRPSLFTVHFYTFYRVPCSSYGDIRCSPDRCVSEVFNCTTRYLFGNCAETVQYSGCSSDLTPEETVHDDDDDDEDSVGLKAAGTTCGILAFLGFFYWLKRNTNCSADDNVTNSMESTPVFEPESIPPLQTVLPSTLDASAPAYHTLHVREPEPEVSSVCSGHLDASAPAYNSLDFRVPEAEVSSNNAAGNVVIDDVNVAFDQEPLPPPSYDDVMSQEDFYRVTESSGVDT